MAPLRTSCSGPAAYLAAAETAVARGEECLHGLGFHSGFEPREGFIPLRGHAFEACPGLPKGVGLERVPPLTPHTLLRDHARTFEHPQVFGDPLARELEAI